MVYRLGERTPRIEKCLYVAPNASVIGSVLLAENTSVWFGVILRGDIERITIGANSNVQDGVVMHTDPGCPLEVGSDVSIGHQATLHGCKVEDGSLIGIQAVVLSGAVIGKNCLVGAKALVTERKFFPERSLILGAPAKVVRQLNDAEIEGILAVSRDYMNRARTYRETFGPTAP